MRRIHIVPQRMVDAVHAHLHDHEEVPVFRSQEMTRELEALAGHFINVSQNLFFVAGSIIAHIQNIFADHLFDLLL